MNTNNDELLKVLAEIRELLVPISVCHEEQYLEIQKRKRAEKRDTFRAMLTPIRREMYPLLFDPRRLSQVEIADEINTSQPTVSRFVNMLLEQDLIEPISDEDGSVVYRDKYDLISLCRTGGQGNEEN